MSQLFRDRDEAFAQVALGARSFAGPSEGESHTEHRAALDATVFRPEIDSARELVLELEAGELRIRRSG